MSTRTFRVTTFIGDPCKRCGLQLRYKSSMQCVACKAERKRSQRIEARERRRLEGREPVKPDTNIGRNTRNAEAMYAAAEHLRVRWVFDWRGPAPSQPNNVTGD